MSLLEQQNFLARLYTDENLRRAFLKEPERVGKQNGLDEKEVADLRAVPPAELNFFAESLVWKRLREVEKLLPLTKKSLGKDFETHFREFAGRLAPAPVKKHFEDAIRFAEFLRTKKIEPPGARDAAKFEAANLEFYNSDRRFALKMFDYDIREIARPDAPARREFDRRKTFAAWLRVGKKSRRYVW